MVHKPEIVASLRELSNNESYRLSPRLLTQAILEIMDMLAMYQAELASILDLKCSDIGEMVKAKKLLKPHTNAWQQAILFIHFYDILFDQQAGEGVAMRNWLRRKHPYFVDSPLILMVDSKRLSELVKYMEDQY